MMNKTRLITDADAVSFHLPSKSPNPQFAAPAWDTRFALLLVKAGQDIAIADIRRRHTRGLRNLATMYLPLVDEAWILNGAVTPPGVIWRRLDVDEWIGNTELWQLIRSLVGGDL